MNLCNKHDVAYDRNDCPACNLEEEIKEKDKEISRLERELSNLEQDTE